MPLVPQFSLEPRRLSWPPFCCSLLLHLSVILFVYQFRLIFPFLTFPQQSVQLQPIKENEIVYYHLEPVKSTVDVPNVKLASRGSREADAPGSHPSNPGSDPKLMIAVRLPAADNQLQTILQPAFPPDIKIKTNIALPDVIPTALAAAKPSLVPHPRVLTIRQASAPLPLRPPPPVLIKSDEVPKLALPEMKDVAVVLAKPEIQANDTDRSQGGSAAGLLILNRTPGQLSEVLAVPAGNRFGEFSVSPSGSNGPGSNKPRGDGRAGSPDAASGEGSGGKRVGGKGNGGDGGEADISVVVSGSPNGGGLGIRAVPPDSLQGRGEPSIFPILKPPHIRKAPFLVAAGPGGGGGLNIYGALKGGKIYTVFLKMPGKDWILEYSASDNLAQHTNQVTFGNPVAPPDATEEFDFQRVPVPPENRNKLIVLKARIGADGLVANLTLYRGVQPQADALALEAFAKWKFIPATRDGQPLPVDVLVGIPVIR
jgi:hypothetical protein